MYNAEIVSVDVNKKDGTRIVKVRFQKGQETVTRDLKYQIYTPVDQIKVAIKQQAEELERGESNVLTTGALDFAQIDSGIPEDQQEFLAWFQKKKKLGQLLELVSLGVYEEKDLPEVATLRQEVKDGHREIFHSF